MAIAAVSATDTDSALERIRQERAQREQERLAQLQADSALERVRRARLREQRRLDALFDAGHDAVRERTSALSISQQEALRVQDDWLAEQRVRETLPPAPQLIEERQRIEGQNAYRAQSTPPGASSLTDVRV